MEEKTASLQQRVRERIRVRRNGFVGEHTFHIRCREHHSMVIWNLKARIRATRQRARYYGKDSWR